MVGAARFRWAIAITSTVCVLVSVYLHTAKLRLMEQALRPVDVGEIIPCGSDGGCVKAQMSAWGWFFGLDVALIAAVGFAAILGVCLLGVQRRWLDASWPTWALSALIGPAVLFTLRLKYAEFYVLRTFCPWCAVLTAGIVLCAALIILDARRIHHGRAASGGSVPPIGRTTTRLQESAEPRD